MSISALMQYILSLSDLFLKKVYILSAFQIQKNTAII